MRQTEPDMLQGVEHGTESQLVETGDATEEDPENLVPEMDRGAGHSGGTRTGRASLINTGKEAT